MLSLSYYLGTVDVHVVGILLAFAACLPAGAVCVVVGTLVLALLARHRATLQHPSRILLTLAGLSPVRTPPATINTINTGTQIRQH